MKREARGIFTDKEIKNLKPESKEYWIREGQGFCIRVLSSGEKLWYYIYTFEGRKRFMRLGEGNYPDLSIADARKLYDAAKMKVVNGIDPLAEKEKQKHERLHAPTVAELVSEYISRYAMKEKRSWKKDESILNREVIPAWGKLKAADITKRDVNLLMGRVRERGAPIMARNALAVVRKMFNWAVSEDILQATPCLGIKAPPASAPRKRHLLEEEEEIRILWESLDRPDLSMLPETRNALKLVLVTAQRPGEVLGMHSREIKGHWWTIPSERTKNKKTHRVYLTDMALDLIGALTVRNQETGKEEERGYIFPSPLTDADKPMGSTALSVAVSRNLSVPVLDGKGKPVLDAKGKPVTENKLGVKHFTPHDLRRTAATLLAQSKIRYEDRERVLNHTLGKLDDAYNQHDYDDEKQQALETLERKLCSIIHGSKTADVIPITRGVAA